MKKAPRLASCLVGIVWPVSSFVLLAVLPLLPLRSMLFNAGYTKWFHWVSLSYLLTQNSFLSKFLAVMGLTVTLGWWASMAYDFIINGSFAHVLYWNMPWTEQMLDEETKSELVFNQRTMPYVILTHVMDTLAHPLLAAYFWKVNNWNVTEICTWPVLISAYSLSRVWSLVHSYYNQGKASLFYMGYDVYHVPDPDAWLPGYWLPAYIAEIAALVACRVYIAQLMEVPSKQQKVLSSSHPVLARSSTSLSDDSGAFSE